MRRVHSIDIVRGLVMILMALDHTRDLLQASTFVATDLDKASPALFFTRWVTHLCAPSFVFLSGTSAFLSVQRTNDIKASRRFLLTRGLWLILLEITVVDFLLFTDYHYRIMFLQVIFAIGAGFLLLALVLKVPARWLAVLGLALIFGHDLVKGTGLWTVLFLPSVNQLTPNFMLAYLYPVLPWFGIMVAGYACGPLFQKPEQTRRRLFLWIGLGALALFLLIRWTNVYGDPAPWEHRIPHVYTFLSFINVTKYPPSLMYTLLMLGIMFLLLAAAEVFSNKVTDALEVYGRVPLYYYVWHLFLIHTAMFIMVFAQGFTPSQLIFGPFLFGRPAAGSGLSLPGVYAVWLLIVAIMYPICLQYGRYKAAHREKQWLRFV